MKIAYFDCFSGASGDMLLGALVDCGMDPGVLEKIISSLGLARACRVRIEKVLKNKISATQIFIELTSEDQPQRTLSDIREIITNSDLSADVKTQSLSVFQRLAEAEAKIHGCRPDNIHFHEVGAIDSIVDIVGVVAGLEALGVEEVFASPLPLGSGFAKTQHGQIPLPSPATVELLKCVPVYGSGTASEMVTPTGAALLREFVRRFGPIPAMEIRKVGYGAGISDLSDRPNVVRLLMGEALSSMESKTDLVMLLETAIDDASPELMGYVMERLLEEGALDVAFFPVHMKKNRPGVHLEVIARPQEADRLCDIILSEITTLGVRYQMLQRKVLERWQEEIESPWGSLRIKKVRRVSGEVWIVPEYEACKEVARKHRISLGRVFAWVERLNE